MGSVWGPSRGLPMVQFVFFGLICDARDLFVLISVIGFIRFVRLIISLPPPIN